MGKYPTNWAVRLSKVELGLYLVQNAPQNKTLTLYAEKIEELLLGLKVIWDKHMLKVDFLYI